MVFSKCSSFGCPGKFLNATDDVVFSCPICGKINCLRCKAVHEDQTCDEYHGNLEIITLDCLDSSFSGVISDGVISNNNDHQARDRGDECFAADLAAINELVDVIPNAEPFACPICLTDYEPGLGVMLRQCLHYFCQNCLRNHLTHSTDVEIKCPFVDPANRLCESILLPREIRALLSDTEHNKYLGRSLQVAESTIKNTFHCLTADCNGWCVIENNAAEFLCATCDKPNCLACKVIHEGQTCEEYVQTTPAYKLIESNNLSADALEGMLRNGKVMKCPSCEAIIQKTTGCDGMQCSICKTHLCWATKGARWGPKGQGDITGGCRCKVNGKKCHPRCQNCH